MSLGASNRHWKEKSMNVICDEDGVPCLVQQVHDTTPYGVVVTMFNNKTIILYEQAVTETEDGPVIDVEKIEKHLFEKYFSESVDSSCASMI